MKKFLPLLLALCIPLAGYAGSNDSRDSRADSRRAGQNAAVSKKDDCPDQGKFFGIALGPVKIGATVGGGSDKEPDSKSLQSRPKVTPMPVSTRSTAVSSQVLSYRSPQGQYWTDTIGPCSPKTLDAFIKAKVLWKGDAVAEFARVNPHLAKVTWPLPCGTRVNVPDYTHGRDCPEKKSSPKKAVPQPAPDPAPAAVVQQVQPEPVEVTTQPSQYIRYDTNYGIIIPGGPIPRK